MINTNRLGYDEVKNEARTEEAYLEGVKGKGVLQVWRGRRNDILGIAGSWHAAPGEEVREQLKESIAGAEGVIYDGPVNDPLGGQKRQRIPVTISSVSSYRLDGEGQPTHLFINFTPVEPDELK